MEITLGVLLVSCGAMGISGFYLGFKYGVTMAAKTFKDNYDFTKKEGIE